MENKDEEKINVMLFNIEELEKSLDKIKIKCLEPFIDNNLDLEENKEFFTYYLFIKASFRTLDILQKIIKTNN